MKAIVWMLAWGSLQVWGQGRITTVAGSRWVFDGDTKPATQAPIDGGTIAIDFRDNVYLSDAGNCMVHRIDRQGTLTVIAGNGGCNGDDAYNNVVGRTASLFFPGGVGVDRRRNVFISAGSKIIRWNLGGFLNRVAGGGYGNSPDGTIALQASLTYPGPVVFDRDGNMYFREENKVRRVRADNGRLETVAGNGGSGSNGDGGSALNASLAMGECGHLAFDSQGNLLICERDGRKIRKVDMRTGIITTVAGDAAAYWDWTIPRGDGGLATRAAIWPSAMAVDAQDNIYISDGGRIRRVTPAGVISNYVGQDYEYGLPRGLAVDSMGNLYIRERFVYKVTPQRSVSIFAGNGNIRFGGDSGPASFASMLSPGPMAYDRNTGTLYIGDSQGPRIRKVDSNGVITTIAGVSGGGTSRVSGVPAAGYPLSSVSGLALDASGRLWISDNNSCGMWRIETNGLMTHLGGFGEQGCPRTVVAGPDGTIYSLLGGDESEANKNTVWRMMPDGSRVRIAGSGGSGFSGDGGPALSAKLNGPSGLAVDSSGRIFISEYYNNRIRRIDTDGTIRTIAGTGIGELSGDGGPATSAGLSGPGGLTFDSANNLYVADHLNHRIRRITPSGIITTFAGKDPYGNGGDTGLATNGGLTYPSAVVFDNGGNLLITDSGNHVVRSVLASLPAFDLRNNQTNEPLSLVNFSVIQGLTAGQLTATMVLRASAFGLSYTVTADSAPWLRIQPTQGTTSDVNYISLTADPTGLTPKTYEGFVVVTVPNAVPRQRRVRVVLTVLPSADLGIAGRVLQAPGLRAPVGSDLSFSYTLTNNSQTVSDNIAAVGTLPAGVTFVSCSVQGGACSGSASGGVGSCPNCGSFTARLDDMVGSATTQIVVVAKLATVLNSVSLRSDVSADTTDNDLSNNNALSVANFDTTPGECTFTLSSTGTTIAASGGTFVVTVSASAAGCAWTASGTTSWLTADRAGATGTQTITLTAAANAGAGRSAVLTIGGASFTLNQAGTATSPGGTRFVSLTPCRVMETRAEYNFDGRTGFFGPPFLVTGEARTLTLPASNVCRNIPATAKAFVVNVTLIPRGAVDFVTVYPGGETRPNTYTVRSPDGLIVANSAIVGAGPGGTINVYASNPTDIVIDISGYFTDDAAVSNLVYYPLTPCRVIDTRAAYRQPAGPFASPSLSARQTRNFTFPGNPYCSIPAGVAAYSVTITVAPPGSLAFLSAWPQGTTQPNVSTLNSPNGRTLANSVILPASANGGISTFAFDNTDMIVDINGYFAPDDGVNGLYYYPARQCRFSDSTFENETRRTVSVSQSACSIPATARAYALNATVVPNGSPMPFLSVWPTGQSQPNASVINAFEGQTVSSGFLVPAGTNGSVDVFAYRRTQVILEISGYFGR